MNSNGFQNEFIQTASRERHIQRTLACRSPQTSNERENAHKARKKVNVKIKSKRGSNNSRSCRADKTQKKTATTRTVATAAAARTCIKQMYIQNSKSTRLLNCTSTYITYK